MKDELSVTDLEMIAQFVSELNETVGRTGVRITWIGEAR
jgi:hypothetical protein